MTNKFEFIIREHHAGSTRNITNPYYSKLETLDMAEFTARKYGRIGSRISIREVNEDYSHCEVVKRFKL